MKRAVFVLAVVFVCAEGLQGQPQPVAERAALRFLRKPNAKTNAVLLVQFSAGTRPKNGVTLGKGRGSATLRDDGAAPDEKAGDGIFSAAVLIDVPQFEARQKLMLGEQSSPLFVGRELVGSATAALTTKAIAWDEIPLIPNRWNYVRPKKGKVALALPLAAPAPGALVPLYPLLAVSLISDAGKSLLITTPFVVKDRKRTNDPCGIVSVPGPWTFGHLMAEMANGAGIAHADFLNRWLGKWLTDQTINTFTVAARLDKQSIVIDRWAKTASGDPNLFAAPFQLVAIVNRIDLGGNLAYGSGDAGEARFIFAYVNPRCVPQANLVIFEYKVNVTGCGPVKKWAQQWKDLEALDPADESYRTALQAITDQFTEEGTTRSQIPNHSSLAQLRTNVFFASEVIPWELREFRLLSAPRVLPRSAGYLYEDTVTQTPDNSFNRTALLADYLNANSAAIVAQTHTVPRTLPTGEAFLAGSSLLPGNRSPTNPAPRFYWDGPPPPARTAPSASLAATAELRHRFSLNTCNGCHGQETGAPFAHVEPNGVLSGFLKGIDVPDPANEIDPATGVVKIRRFEDLLLRQVRMAQILAEPCFGGYLLGDLFFDPIRMPH